MEESKIMSCAWMWSEGQGDTYVFPKEALLDFAKELLSIFQQAEPECSEERPCIPCFADDGACKAEPAPAQDEQQPVLMVRTKGSHTWEQIDAESFELCQQDSDYECREFYLAPIAQTTPQPEQEPFWYAVVSEQAPSINTAIKRLDVAQEYADSKRERWPDTRVVPLYTTQGK